MSTEWGHDFRYHGDRLHNSILQRTTNGSQKQSAIRLHDNLAMFYDNG